MKVNDIFYSIQGESTFTGLPCAFVRLTGCNLRCRYCDTTYAYEKGYEASIDEIEKQILKYRCNLIEITGGEPLLQRETPELAQRFVNRGAQVLVETNGTLDISVLPPPMIRIMDIKCPGSSESEKTAWNNIQILRPTDEVKFIISHRQDFDWAISIVNKYQLLSKATVLFSSAFGMFALHDLAKWILETKLPIRLQLQLHKYILFK